MTLRSYTILLALTLLLLVTFSNMDQVHNNVNNIYTDCKPKCTYRCSATSHKKPCMFFCQKCCAKCLCVPPGTYGNKEGCPCYNNWKTKEGKPKCP
ncbi:unnamed protein product [Lupinus luteus]|uniref:Protein RSI-1 n=1 Tax=Lupinus luteus TaxID=3873 RepID=A0AAV1X1Y8_LUPLU